MTVEVTIGDPDSSLAAYAEVADQVESAVWPILEKCHQTVDRLRKKKKNATKETEEWNRWIDLERKFSDHRYRSTKFGYIFDDLKGKEPPIEEAQRRAVDNAVEEYSTTEQHDALLATLGLRGFKLDRSRVLTKIEEVENLSDRWRAQELRLLKELEGVDT